jgi:hypothetical protein
MNRQTLLVFLIILFACTSAIAQETEPKYKFGIGGGAGFATGYGLSFRYVPKRLGVQVNFAPYKTSDLERYSVGVTLLYLLIENKISNLFIYQANHYYYNSQLVTYYNPNLPNSEEKIRTTEGYVNNGVGFGIEIIMAKRISLNLMTGYAFYNTFSQLNITAEVALYYKF